MSKRLCKECGHDISGPGEGDSYGLCGDIVTCKTRELRRHLGGVEAELERWRHGQQFGVDYVCPDSLRAHVLEDACAFSAAKLRQALGRTDWNLVARAIAALEAAIRNGREAKIQEV